MTTKIKPEIVEILSRCDVQGDSVRLPDGQLDRKTYEAVNKALEAIGGKWKGGKIKAHIFPRDVSEDFMALVDSGEYTDQKKELSFFPTPAAVVDRMIELAAYPGSSLMTLEPSAGKGAIVEKVPGNCVMVEVDALKCETLFERFGYPPENADFLEWHPAPDVFFDRVLMNPPFNKRDEDQHVCRAFDMLKSGGILVAILPEGWFFREDKKAVNFRDFTKHFGIHEEELDPGAFKESGTMIKTRIVVLRKP